MSIRDSQIFKSINSMMYIGGSSTSDCDSAHGDFQYHAGTDTFQFDVDLGACG